MEAVQTQKQQNKEDRVIRILSKDIEGKMKVYSGLTKVKGISWAVSNAICKKLGIEKSRSVGSLSEAEIKKIEDFMKKPVLPGHIVNRNKDFDSGEDRHIIGSDLELRKDFDIKRLKKIKSYRGLRHSSKLPLRGQRTKGNFRPKKMKGGGIKKKK